VFTFLLALLRSDTTGGGGPFVVAGVNLSLNQRGTSCGDKYKVNASLAYTGGPSGKTCLVESNTDGAGWVTEYTGVAPTDFPVVIALDGYYNKFGANVSLSVRATDESNSSNTATSDQYGATITPCL
jgi:hypothetical protein